MKAIEARFPSSGVGAIFGADSEDVEFDQRARDGGKKPVFVLPPATDHQPWKPVSPGWKSTVQTFPPVSTAKISMKSGAHDMAEMVPVGDIFVFPIVCQKLQPPSVQLAV